jgi:hypothetical protein
MIIIELEKTLIIAGKLFKQNIKIRDKILNKLLITMRKAKYTKTYKQE